MSTLKQVTKGQDPAEIMTELGAAARAAATALANAPTQKKNAALEAMAAALEAAAADIIAANAKDMAAGEERGLTAALLDRLKLDEGRIAAMANGVREIAALKDPVGERMASWDRPNGLNISRVRVPLGVIGIIYESRPNVTADAGALCLKAGNAVILRGGTEAVHSNHAILTCLQAGLKSAGLPEAAIQLVPTQDRAAVGVMLQMAGVIDVVVPRGGKSLVARVQSEARVPVLAHLDGICHVYVHEKADPAKAVDVTLNSKMRRVGICGAAETLLIDRTALDQLPAISEALIAAGCELRGDADAQKVDPRIRAATEADWETEYLEPILSIRVVDGVDAAMAHIREYGSGHTEAILTEDDAAAARFLRELDSAIVLHNASTQFADGGEFGMGAEIGISTGKLHARGPVGVEQLTSFKYQVRGTGQTRP